MISTDIRIVLVEPSHPGNIGAVARAMKNMALDQLVLVNPKQFPHSEATARASGADDVLANARVVGSVKAAMATPEDMERMYVHLAQVLEEIDFRDRTPGGTSLMARIRRFMQRAELDKNEVNIVRGMLTAMQKRRRHAGDPHSPQKESPQK